MAGVSHQLSSMPWAILQICVDTVVHIMVISLNQVQTLAIWDNSGEEHVYWLYWFKSCDYQADESFNKSERVLIWVVFSLADRALSPTSTHDLSNVSSYAIPKVWEQDTGFFAAAGAIVGKGAIFGKHVIFASHLVRPHFWHTATNG